MSKKLHLIGLDLLDRELIDSNGERCGKVDDLELTVPEGFPEGTAPVVGAILTGPGALGDRLWGWPGRVARVMWRRISPNPAGRRGKVLLEAVERIDSDIHLNISVNEAGLYDRERWAEHFISRIPGSQDEG
jgi:hypothetical protein